MADKLQSVKVVCSGGLITNASDLDLSDGRPGAATSLVNFESGLKGGYRKIDGYALWDADHGEVDPDNAEGPVLVVANLGSTLIAARKQTSGATYKYYTHNGTDWSAVDITGVSLTSTSVIRIRFEKFNFSNDASNSERLIFVDGVNPAIIYDGTDWFQIKSANAGTIDDGTETNSYGAENAVDAPKFVSIWKNTIFLGGDPTYPAVVAYSAPSKEWDWTAASGAGQLVLGFACNGMKPWRDNNFIFGVNYIKKVALDNSLNFVLQDVATDVGCIAPDTIQEFGGDLIFMSQDGFRPIAGTDKIGDTYLETLSRAIQEEIVDLIRTKSLDQVTSVLIKGKSQVRFFFGDSSTAQSATPGIIGNLRTGQNGVEYEWGTLRGIRANCCTSFYRDNTEYVVHGDYNGKVYRQEQGTSFDGAPILAVYSTPYLDQGDTGLRKTFRRVKLFIAPEGDATISTKVEYDWNDINKLNPSNYASTTNTSGSTYGTGVYGTAIYGGKSSPILLNNIQGSGFSVKFTFSDFSTGSSYTIQAVIYDFSTDDRK